MSRRTPTPFEILQIAAANEQVIIPAEGLELLTGKQAKRNKFGAKACMWNGIRFDSKAELAHYGDLRLLELTGHISKLELKPVFQLPGKVKYIADFRYVENGQTVVVDVKGGKATATPAFHIKWKQAQELNPDMKFVIVEK